MQGIFNIELHDKDTAATLPSLFEVKGGFISDVVYIENKFLVYITLDKIGYLSLL